MEAPDVDSRRSTTKTQTGSFTGSFSTLNGAAVAGPIRKLVAGERYFDLEASAFHAGAERCVARVSESPKPHVDVTALAEDFQLEPAAADALLVALLEGGLLQPEGNRRYRLTSRFRDYALAPIVQPLSRARARTLVERACRKVAHINADWPRNPFVVRMVAVSGSYMSRREHLPELALFLVLRPRPGSRVRRWRGAMSRRDALQQILALMTAMSSFIVVRIVADRRAVPRPFSVVFQASDEARETTAPMWERFAVWGASISRARRTGPR
jgi:hypothetical protein